MQWRSVSEFLAMGGYALYVWGSFGMTAAALAVEVWLLKRQRIQTLRALRGDFASETVLNETSS